MVYDLYFGEEGIAGWWATDPFYQYFYPYEPAPYTIFPSQDQVDIWIGEAVDQGVTLAGQYLSQLVGIAPRGDFSKFLREVYQYVLQKAKASGLAVDIFWFGDVVRTNPDGRWGVTYAAGTLALANQYWEQLGQKDHFFVLRCPSGSEDIPQGTCQFQEYGKTISRLFGSTATMGGGTGFIWLLGAAAVGWFLLRRR